MTLVALTEGVIFKKLSFEHFQILHCSLWSIWSWFLCTVRDKDVVSFFSMLIHSFPSAIFWRDWFVFLFFLFLKFSSVYFWKNKVVCICVGFSLSTPFYFVNLHIVCLSDLGPAPWHFYYCDPAAYLWMSYGGAATLCLLGITVYPGSFLLP